MIVENDDQPYLVRGDDSPAEFGELPGESHCLRIIQNVLSKKSTLAKKTIQSFILKKNLLIWRGLIILCPVVAKSVEIQILITKQRTPSYFDVRDFVRDGDSTS